MKNEAIKKSVVLNFSEVRFEVKKCPVCGEEMLHLRRCVEIMRYGDVRVVIMLKRKLTKKFGIITFGQNKVS